MDNNNSQNRLSEAITEYLEAKQAERLGPNTLADYSITPRKFRAHFDNDPLICSITAREVRGFINSLNGVSKKAVLNVHTGLSSPWQWAVEEGGM